MSLAAVNSVFAAIGSSDAVAPDVALQSGTLTVAPDFVLCRDKDGNSTAIYGDLVWDFNPYRLGAKKITKIRFDNAFASVGPEQLALIGEVKYILYCLIYFAGSGRLGKLSAKTLDQYWLALRAAILFCYRQKQKPAVGVLSLRQLLTTPVYLAPFLVENKEKQSIGKQVSSILSGLILAGEDRLGYRVINPVDLKIRRVESIQHPVIPTRIYLGLINSVSDLLDHMCSGIEKIEYFIAEFDDEYYGLQVSKQKSLGVGGRAYYRPNMADALEVHGLNTIFAGEFSCEYRRTLSQRLLKMQYLAKQIIHLYTGMRDQEVMRMSYNCLSDEVYAAESVDDNGVVRDLSKSVSILSTTTKFTGYRKSESWFAPAEVVKAVKVAQAICRGLAKLYKVKTEDNCPLFLNPTVLRDRQMEVCVGLPLASRAKVSAIEALVIEPSDLQELSQTDITRDFYNDPAFAVGQPWPLTSHQFRRSLAFYASNSGFVSLPSLKSQYKHMTIEMARYYSNGFENLRTIFGYYDTKKKEFVLPSSHVALEFQMGMPMAVANQLLSDVLFRDAPLFGGTGSYMEKQKTRLDKGEVCIEDVRAETVARVKSGDISYRPTLLGGCTKVGRCDYFLLGDYTECLSCEGAIIKPEKVNDAIEAATAELSKYAEDSGEYQITKGDIERLSSFKT